jgi:hypothetical protein
MMVPLLKTQRISGHESVVGDFEIHRSSGTFHDSPGVVIVTLVAWTGKTDAGSIDRCNLATQVCTIVESDEVFGLQRTKFIQRK